jgi:hypothetical protein
MYAIKAPTKCSSKKGHTSYAEDAAFEHFVVFETYAAVYRHLKQHDETF